MRDMVEISDFFDSFGHIDYLARYVFQADKFLRYEIFPEEYDALLGLVAQRGLALEINTQRLGSKAVRESLFPIYKRFNALGGRYVTIGSDAHDLKHIGYCHEEARRLASETGLQVVYFKKRKMFVCD